MFKVGVIGLGSIAAFYGKPEDPNSYCHAAGILHCERTELAAVADLAEDRRERFRGEWGDCFPGTRYYAGAAEMLAEEDFDVVAVCARGPHHYAVMQEVLAASPRAVFLEKPPFCSLAEADETVAAAAARGIPITVSYSRHWSPKVLRMQELIAEGLIGEVRQVVGYTGHSVLSFASHTTDLICQFAGYDPLAVYARGQVQGEPPEGYEPEPGLEAMVVEYASGRQGIQLGSNGQHASFYCEVLGTEGMARAGIYVAPYAQDQERREIDLAGKTPPEESVFTVAYRQIADWLEGGPLPACTDAQWHAVNEIGWGAIESIHSGERLALPNTRRARRVFANG